MTVAGHCAIATIALTLSACAPANGQPSAAVTPAPEVRVQPCGTDRGPALATAECGSLRVFEDRVAKHGRTIDIAFARLRAHSGKATGAVFFLAGGPGSGGTGLVAFADRWAQPLRESLDLVFMDQRGTGQSNPLECRQQYAADPASAFGHIFHRVNECREVLEKSADLRQYSTDSAVADLDDLRAALGYDTIGLYGGSYGTRLAQAYMRRFPDRTNAVVLDGTMPFDVKAPLTYAASAQRSIDLVIESCTSDATCRGAHPTLAADFKRLLSLFAHGPVTTGVRPRDSPRTTVTMSLGDFGYAVRGMLYSAQLARQMPDMITRAARRGDLSEFAQHYWERRVRFDRALATGLHLSVLCAEDVRDVTDDEAAAMATGTFLGRYVIDEYRSACADWPAAEIAADFRSPVRSSVPTLLVSGRLDPVTPPAFAEGVAQTLTASIHIVVPDGSHGSLDGCARDAALFVLQQRTVKGVRDVCQSRSPAP